LFGDTARDLHTFVMRLHIFEAILPRVYYFPAFVTVISLTFDSRTPQHGSFSATERATTLATV